MRKKTLFFVIPLILTIGIIPAISFSEQIESPRKQMAMGTAAEDVICKTGYDLMIRYSGSAACVKPSTSMKLESSDWGTIGITAEMMEEEYEEIMNDKEMTEKESMETMTIGGIDLSMAASPEGSTDALITIVEFGDFQCPQCDLWFLNEKPIIEKNFIETGRVKLYFVDFMFIGSDSVWAALASYCAEDQGRYWEYHSHLYDNQAGVNEGWASPDNLKFFASELGLDTTQFDKCLDSKKYLDRIAYNTGIAESQGVESTPVFFIIGPDGSTKRINGPQPSSVFENIINELS